MGELRLEEWEIPGYERVVQVKDPSCGLHGIIALHDTRAGPALGGIRAYPYADEKQALQDVLRLAQGMTFKAGISQTGTGGGKSVLLWDTRLPKPPGLWEQFAEAINRLEGMYIGAEDVGTSVAELGILGSKTPYAVGLPHPKSSGDPSPFTAFGGIRGIESVARFLWGSPSLLGKTVAIQGLGSVGMKLAELLFWRGARLIVADIDAARVAHAVRTWGAQACPVQEVLTVACDILAPCALGAILHAESIPHFRCQAVAGLANNQLLHEEDGERLRERGILYAPDFVINSGGLLNVCTELEEEGYHPRTAWAKIDQIENVLLSIFQTSAEKGLSTHQVAEEIALSNIAQGIGKREKPLVFHHAC